MTDLLSFPPAEGEYPVQCRVRVVVTTKGWTLSYSAPIPDSPTGEDLLKAISEICTTLINENASSLPVEEGN